MQLAQLAQVDLNDEVSCVWLVMVDDEWLVLVLFVVMFYTIDDG